MRTAALILAGMLLVVQGALDVVADNRPDAPRFNPQLTAYIRARIAEFEQIPEARKGDLKRIAAYVRGQLDAGRPAQLIFICTHNSRRSHMSQLWASDAASYYQLPRVQCYSGGTEATAFNPRAVAALERAGMKIEKSSGEMNPPYRVHVAEGLPPLVCFSKKYSDTPNPQSDFCAVMTCSEADKSCPVVHGATLRAALHFEDPKAADGSPQEAAKYDERCAQIAREMLYLFSQVRPVHGSTG